MYTFFEVLRSPHLLRCEMTRWSRICSSFCNVFSFWGGTTQMFIIYPKMWTILRGVPKSNIVVLRNKNQSIGLDEYSRLMVYFLPYANIWLSYGRSSVKFRWFARENRSFSNFTADIGESVKVSDIWLSPVCSFAIYLRGGIHLKNLRRYYRCLSSGKPKGHVCRSAPASAHRSLRAWGFHFCLRC